MGMNPVVKELWLTALRSGNYKQGEGQLHSKSRGEAYCCLGVACEVAVAAGLPLQVETTEFGNVTYDGQRHYLPQTVAEWMGLGSQGYVYDGSVNVNLPIDSEIGDGLSLSSRNDSGLTFDEIADLIEEHL